MFFLFFSFSGAFGQERCGTKLSAREIADQLKQAPEIAKQIKEYEALKGTSGPGWPIFFQKTINIVFVDPTYSSGYTSNNQSSLNAAINTLNSDFSGTNLHFVQLGNSIVIPDYNLFVDNLKFSANVSEDPALANFVIHGAWRSKKYVDFEPVIMVYLNYNDDNFSRAQFPVAGNAQTNHITLEIFGDKTFSHEMGHTFNLLHTFEGSNAYYYKDPGANVKTLHFGPPNAVVDPNKPWLKPEKVARSAESWLTGDFLRDTPADPYIDGVFQPNNPSTCQYTGGNATDVDGDIFTPSIPNIMSYYYNCRNEFTNDQDSRMVNAYNDIRQYQLNQYATFDISDYIEFEGTTEKIERVTVDYNISGTNKKCITTSNLNSGQLKAMKYGYSLVDPKTVRPPLGVLLGVAQNGGNQSSQLTPYSGNEWRSGISVSDYVTIIQYVLGTPSALPTGYKKLAADMNRDGKINVKDIIKIRRIILHINHATTIRDANNRLIHPYAFVPEYVSQTYSSSFNSNPFSITNALYPNYISRYQSYTYPIVSGKMGFDMVKMGDLNGTSCASCFQGEENLSSRNEAEFILKDDNLKIQKGEIVKVSFSMPNTKSILGYQFGMKVRNDLFDLVDFEKSELGSTEEYFNFETFEKGEIRTLWASMKGEEYSFEKGNSEVFSFYIKAKRNLSSTRELFMLSNDVLQSEFISKRGKMSNVDIELKFNRVDRNSLDLHDNKFVKTNKVVNNSLVCYPNPAKDNVSLFMQIDEAMKADIVFRDISGREIIRLKESFEKGQNQKSINLLTLGIKGLIFISVETKNKQILSTSIIVE